MAQQDSTKQAAVEQAQLPTERKQFKGLVLSNPNYFGTFPKFGGKPIKAISGDTTYEQLTCLGLNQGRELLETVINIKLHTGYGTDACGAGTTEYVRFFVQDTTGWHDLGISTVQVHDLAGPLPLSYSVSVDFSEARKFCTVENIVNVRAILSWEWTPTPGDPNFIPVWGNVVNAKVQVAPQFFFEVPISELVAQKVISIDPGVLSVVDTSQALPASPPTALNYADLKGLYAKTEVPVHRYGFETAMKTFSVPIANALALSSASSLTGEELASTLAAIQKTKGDTTYEQLTCAGYNPQTQELEGVVLVRQSSGYSGGLCTHGSTEYVSFYAFFGGVWNALGTTQVQVHDLKAASPTHPISYAVVRFSNLTSMPCEKLEGVPLRAILSWSTPPTGPNFVPVWGNIIDTHVQPQIAATVGEGMRLMRIGQVTVANIGNGTGLAVVDPLFVPPLPPGLGYVAGDCPGGSPWLVFSVEPNSPFGGETLIEGDFNPKIDVFDHTTGMVLPGAFPIIYQAWVTPPSGPAFQLTDSFGIELYPPNAIGGVFYMQHLVPSPGPVSGGVVGAQYYVYYESNLQAVNPRTIAEFDAGGLAEGNYSIEILGFEWNGTQYVAIAPQGKMIHVYNGYEHTELVEPSLGAPLVAVTEYRPQVFITLTSPSGDCGDVQVGDTIIGSYSVTDEFFGIVTVALVPITIGGVLQPENAVTLSNANYGAGSVAYDGTNTAGTGGTFTLPTAGMTPCGYTILLQAWDRALTNNTCYGHYNEDGVGFCLRKKGT